ncbi:hypothetical protein [Bacillus sp. 165]|uniref:hypothetical protein n=1 Tax=Bacillus sp. 165 TaxID=1529117 RepID=UPI001ADAEF72|nr:hypothetical protein [Bacillus sp. 165]MBO9129099.1 hypothetical protein [Bacillus sp. 165]
MSKPFISQMVEVTTELFIPISSMTDNKKLFIDWNEKTKEFYNLYSTYFIEAISSFLYEDTKWYHKLLKTKAVLSCQGIDYEIENKQYNIFISEGNIVCFPTQAYLILKIHATGVPDDICAINSSLTSLDSRSKHIQIEVEGKKQTILNYANELLAPINHEVTSSVSKVFGYSLLEVDDETFINNNNPYLPVFKNFFQLAAGERLLEKECKDALWQFASRIQTFSLCGSITIIDTSKPFNKNHYKRYHHSLYRDLTLMALYQIDFLNKISLELSDVENLILKRKLIIYFRKLFLNFTNKAWFSHISLRPQAQLLWDRWQSQFQSEHLYNDITTQLEQLTGFIQQDRSWWLSVGLGLLTLVSWGPVFTANIQPRDASTFLHYAILIPCITLPVLVGLLIKSDKLRGFFYKWRFHSIQKSVFKQQTKNRKNRMYDSAFSLTKKRREG